MSRKSSLPTPTKKMAQEVAKLTPDQLEEIHDITYKAIANFKGQADKLETALGDQEGQSDLIFEQYLWIKLL